MSNKLMNALNKVRMTPTRLSEAVKSRIYINRNVFFTGEKLHGKN